MSDTTIKPDLSGAPPIKDLNLTVQHSPNSAHVATPPSIRGSANEIPPFEKLKFYTDLYKFYCELPIKIGAAYSVASTLILAVTANYTRSPTIIALVAGFILAVGIFIGVRLFIVEKKYIEPFKDDVNIIAETLGINNGPNFNVMKFILRLSVFLLILLPLTSALIVFFFLTGLIKM